MSGLTLGTLREQIRLWRAWCEEILESEPRIDDALHRAKKAGADEVAKELRRSLDQFEADWVTPPPARPQLRLVVDNGKRQESQEERDFEVPGGGATPPGGGSAA